VLERHRCRGGAKISESAHLGSTKDAMMQIYTTAPMEEPLDARKSFRQLEEIGHHGAFSFEAKPDPFLPLVLAAENTTSLRLGTASAIAFARIQVVDSRLRASRVRWTSSSW
jgi:hypothetical protein